MVVRCKKKRKRPWSKLNLAGRRQVAIHVTEWRLSLRVHIRPAAHLISQSWQLSPTGVNKPIANLHEKSVSQSPNHHDRNQHTWLIESPVLVINICLSSSLGYGWSRCSWNQARRISVTGFGRFPRRRFVLGSIESPITPKLACWPCAIIWGETCSPAYPICGEGPYGDWGCMIGGYCSVLRRSGIAAIGADPGWW